MVLTSKETSLINNNEIKVYSRIIKNLDDCSEFKFNVAFVVFGGVQILLDKLKELENKNIKGKIITTNYMDTTQIDAIRKILKFKNVEVKVYDSKESKIGLHAKTYIFKKDNNSKVIIGSSNITRNGLITNCEWNVEMEYSNESISFCEIEEEFEKLWETSKDFDESLFDNKNYKVIEKQLDELQIVDKNKIQEQALQKLEELRLNNKNKALVIAATGTGKTFLSAFDVEQFNAKKLLFLCHRWEILDGAIKTFKTIFPNKVHEKFNGELKWNNSFVFSTVQTMTNKYQEFDKESFDYIIVDEAHHCASKSYQFIFEYFKPKFLLGLTATPERYDGKDIYQKFDNNIALNVRLKNALDENLLCPFNYFGVSELSSIDLSNVDISNVKTYEKKLMIKERVDLIIDKLNFYINPYQKLKCLAFCASVDHANYMSDEFNKLGKKSICLSGDANPDFRSKAIKEFKDGNIEVIFTVDIFNEGIDIPEVNTILMLRPTESPTIFIQQLGRGLRKFANKEFVTVIDFIGNHKNVYNLAFSFGADYLYDKKSIKDFVESDFQNFSKFSFFKIDQIAKERILENIESINFDDKKWITKTYEIFKSNISNGNNLKIPMWLDYLNSDTSPDIVKFIKKSDNKSYYDFLEKIVKENVKQLSKQESNILRTFESFLPLKRNYEFTILNEINTKGVFDTINFDKELFINFDNESFKSSVSNLLLKHFDKKEKLKYNQIIKFIDNKLYFKEEVNDLKNKDNFIRRYFNELFIYGLNKYNNENNKDEINKIKLWETYSRNQILAMFNFDKEYSSVREGVKKIKNNYLIFVTLDKQDMKNELHKYKDCFIDQLHFQWESQNPTSIESETGQNLINHKNRNINLHIFIRNDKKDKPYYYFGKADVLSYSGSKPIRFNLKFQKIIPNHIYKIFN